MSAIIAVPFILLMLFLVVRESRKAGPRRLTQLERRRFDAWVDDHEVRL